VKWVLQLLSRSRGKLCLPPAGSIPTAVNFDSGVHSECGFSILFAFVRFSFLLALSTMGAGATWRIRAPTTVQAAIAVPGPDPRGDRAPLRQREMQL
jgi:hypothetical protein